MLVMAGLTGHAGSAGGTGGQDLLTNGWGTESAEMMLYGNFKQRTYVEPQLVAWDMQEVT